MTTTTRQAVAASLFVIKELGIMSTGTKQPYVKAYSVADKVLNGLSSACTRIEIAGSLRRQKDMIGDIELVAIPDGERLYELLDTKLADGVISHLPKKRWGLKLRSFLFAGFQFDVFIQPDPATWGYNFLVRTGSAEFSHKLVTKRSEGGWKPDCFEIKDARVKCDGMLLDTSEEIDIFNLWGMDYVAPPFRTDTYKPPRLDSAQYEKIEQNLRAKGLGIEGQPALRFTFADAERLTRESATWPLPVFKGDEARKAIEASEQERRRIQGVRG